MTYDYSWLKTLTFEKALEDSLAALRRLDEKDRNAQGLPSRRSELEGVRYRHLIDASFDAFRLQVKGIDSLAPDDSRRAPQGSDRHIVLEKANPDNRFGFIYFAVAVPVALAKAFEERTNVPQPPTDFGKCTLLIASLASHRKEIISAGLIAGRDLAYLELGLSDLGSTAGIILNEIVEDNSGQFRFDSILELSSKSEGDDKAYYSKLFKFWHANTGREPPSPLE